MPALPFSFGWAICSPPPPHPLGDYWVLAMTWLQSLSCAQVIFEKDKELAAKQAAGGDGEEELRQELQKKQERIGQLKVQIAELNKKLNDKLNEKR